MPSWRRTLNQLADALDDGVDRAREVVLGPRVPGPPRLALYRGFGTERSLEAMGRVLRDAPLPAATRDDSQWRNLLATLRRFDSTEVGGARVRLAFGDAVRVVTTDSEGYFRATLEPSAPVDAERGGWHDVRVELLPGSAAEPGDRATARVLVPSPHASFGVISDIDDTVVRTDATQLVRMLRTVFLGNARTRLPFPGVAAFYRALQRGAHAEAVNPIFYVSSGPWNLYELLVEFFALQRIPDGPLLLRDWGIGSRDVFPTHHTTHKSAAIRRVLDRYPTLPFILIGDSGQDDPEIYASVIRAYPGRIHVAYIREVSRAEQRRGALRTLAEELARDGATLLVADDTLAAARHAAEKAWIAREELAGIESEVRADGT